MSGGSLCDGGGGDKMVTSCGFHVVRSEVVNLQYIGRGGGGGSSNQISQN